MLWFSSPLEQFQVVRIFPLTAGFFDISFTNSSFLALLSCFFGYLVFFFGIYQARIVPSSYQLLVENLYSFALSLARENIQKHADVVFPLIFSTFSFVLFANLVGMVPYSFTTTSHLIVTFTLALSLFTTLNIIGIRIHGLAFLGLFLPGGCPLFMAPFLVLIELVSYVFRVLSLAIRLFANMMAGHTLLKIIAGFSWVMFTNGKYFLLSVFHIVPFFVIIPLIGLEFGVACLQAYVFTVLLCIYFNDAISLH